VAALVMALLHRQVRDRDARELLLLGELISAERAKEMGLVNRIVAQEELMDEVLALADGHARRSTGRRSHEKSSRRALAFLIQRWVRRGVAASFDARDSSEAREGVAAFLEKRNPSWQPKPTGR